MEGLWLAALFLVPIAILPSGVAVFIETPKVAILRAIAALLVGLWAFRWALSGPGPARQPGRKATPWGRAAGWVQQDPAHLILASAFLFLAAVVLSSALSPVWRVSVLGREPGRDSFSLYSYATYFVVFLAMAVRVRRTEQLQRMFWAVAAAGVIASLYGIGQHFGFDPVRPISGDVTRSRSSFGNPIFFGSFIVMALPVTIAAVQAATARSGFLAQTAALAVPISIQLVGITYTLSRGPWIGLGVALAAALTFTALLMGWSALRRLGAAAAIAVGVASIMAIVPASVNGRESGSAAVVTDRLDDTAQDLGGGLNSRLTIWKNSARLIAERPWFDTQAYPELPNLPARPLRPLVGYGPEMFLYAYPLEEDVRLDGARHYHAHNFLVHNAVELGALGFVATTTLFGAIGVAGLVYLKRARRERWPLQRKAVLGALCAALGGRFVEQLTGVPQISDLLLMWALAGALAALALMTRAGAPAAPAFPAPAARAAPGCSWWRLAPALAAAAFLAFFSWSTNGRYVYAAVVASSAGSAFNQGDFALSVERLDDAIQLAPDMPAYRLNKATALAAWRVRVADPSRRAELLQDAYAETREVLKRNPLSHQAWASAGQYAREMAGATPEKTALSLRDHEVLVALLPAFWTPKNVLANGYVASNQAARALQPLAQSLAITGRTPEAAPTMYLLGEAFAKLNMSREALKALEESLALDPQHKDAWKAHRRLSELYLAQGDRGQAVSHRAQYLYLLAVGLNELGAREQAIEALAQSVALDQRNPYYEPAQRLLADLNEARAQQPRAATGASPARAAFGSDTGY